MVRHSSSTIGFNIKSKKTSRLLYNHEGFEFGKDMDQEDDDEIGILNDRRRKCSCWSSTPYPCCRIRLFPSIKRWESVNCVILFVGNVLLWITYYPSFEGWTHVQIQPYLSLMHIVVILLSLTRFDARFILWTTLVLLDICGCTVALLVMAVMKTVAEGRTILTLTGMSTILGVWLFRGIEQITLHTLHRRSTLATTGQMDHKAMEKVCELCVSCVCVSCVCLSVCVFE